MNAMILDETPEREALLSYRSVASTSAVGEVVRLLKATMVPHSLVLEERRGRRISDLKGLGREIWQGIEAREYIDELRDEWDRR